MAWYWHRLVPLLEKADHDVVAVDLPAETAGLSDYAELVVRTIDRRSHVVLVAQSLGGFTAALVCDRAPIEMLVFVNAMIPASGETAGDWWGNTGAVEARIASAKERGYSSEFDVATYFLHDVPERVLRDGPPRQREQAGIAFVEPCQFRGWPGIPTHVVASADDRFFPLSFQRSVARERLHKEVDVLSGGHLVALSNPKGLASLLLGFARELPDVARARSG